MNMLGRCVEEEPFEEDEDEFLFNEYSIDDTLDSLTRLERYHGSDFSLQRMVLVRDITDTAHEAGHEQTLKRLLPLLPAFVNDAEPAVRQELAQQMYPLADFVCNGSEDGGDEGYQEVLNSFLPFSIELLSDRNSEVGSAAVDALFKVCTLVRPEQFEAHVLSVIQQLAHDDRVEDYRVVAAELCNELAPLLGKELCLAKIVPEVQQLADDQGFSVRKTVAAHLGKLCKTIGPEEAVAKIFPLYETLSKDMIWGVRKACAESIASISEAVTPEVRHSKLTDIFKSFLEDISRWVRVAASMNLGPYLFTFSESPEPPPASLVSLFTKMAFDTENGTEADYPEFCAFNFPAVARTIGKERWGELENAFLQMIKAMQWKVRKTLSYSLHETAKIVGQEITENVLTQAFELFLGDLDEVRLGCLRNVKEFLEVMGVEKREYYIQEMCKVIDTVESWRVRMVIGSTLGDIAGLVSPQFCREHLVPVCIKIMNDSVSDVRQAVHTSVAKVLKQLCEGDDGDVAAMLQEVVSCATASSFQKRQMFAYIAKEVAGTDNVELFEESLIEPYARVASDPVANVRLIAARCMTEGVMVNETLAKNDSLNEILNKLKQDADTDVCHFAGNPRPRIVDRDRIENEELREQDQDEIIAAIAPAPLDNPVQDEAPEEALESAVDGEEPEGEEQPQEEYEQLTPPEDVEMSQGEEPVPEEEGEGEAEAEAPTTTEEEEVTVA